MDFVVRYRRPASPGKSLHQHFLLKDVSLDVLVTRPDGSRISVPVLPDAVRSSWMFSLTAASGTLVELIFTVRVQSKFESLRIHQHFRVLKEMSGRLTLVAHGWQPPGSQQASMSLHLRPGTHPLLTYDTAVGILELNCLMLDVTAYWLDLRATNPQYLDMFKMMDGGSSRFRVLAHLGGPPLIWYLTWPPKLREQSTVLPHIFFSPADNAEEQPPGDERYFFDKSYASGKVKYSSPKMSDVFDGEGLRNYLATPPSDPQIAADPTLLKYRNVNVFESNSLTFWNTPLGFSKAISEGSVRQILFLPQRHQTDNNGVATTKALLPIVDSTIALMRSHTDHLSQDDDHFAVGKLILSCYSDSGKSIWAAARVSEILDRLRGVICIEPTDMKEQGNKIITDLVRRSVSVHYVGRWRGVRMGLAANSSDWTRIRVPSDILARIRCHPTDNQYDRIWAYPPDVSGNPFVQFRSARFTDLNKDPLSSAEEQKLQLQWKGTPEQLLRRVYADDRNEDSSGNYFSHNFAVSGGETLNSTTSIVYGKAYRFKTFFQDCVEALD